MNIRPRLSNSPNSLTARTLLKSDIYPDRFKFCLPCPLCRCTQAASWGASTWRSGHASARCRVWRPHGGPPPASLTAALAAPLAAAPAAPLAAAPAAASSTHQGGGRASWLNSAQCCRKNVWTLSHSTFSLFFRYPVMIFIHLSGTFSFCLFSSLPLVLTFKLGLDSIKYKIPYCTYAHNGSSKISI